MPPKNRTERPSEHVCTLLSLFALNVSPQENEVLDALCSLEPTVRRVNPLYPRSQSGNMSRASSLQQIHTTNYCVRSHKRSS